MKLVIVVAMMVLFSAGNALAQYSSTNQPAAEGYIDQMSLERCRTDLRQCLEDIATAGADSTALLAALAERMGFSSVDEMLAADCRSRRGTWDGNQCLCAEPNHWFGSDESCCVPSTRRYERQMQECRDSGGSFSCRGGCRCPLGTQLMDGECRGEAATREEIDRLRNRIPQLESELGRIQGELDAAHAQGDDQADQIADLENQLAAAREALEELRVLLALREQQLRDALGTVVPPASPLPGTAEAIAEVAGGSAPNPLAPTTPPPEEDEEGNWCEENGWACAGIIIGALAGVAGVTVGIVEATRDIQVVQ
ncbi:MAG: hypothetical protein WC445_04365 [Patescibacteria group bacterium]